MKRIYLIFLVFTICVSQMKINAFELQNSELSSKILNILNDIKASDMNNKLEANVNKNNIEESVINIQKKRFFKGYLPKINFYVKQGTNGEIYLIPVDENRNHYFIG